MDIHFITPFPNAINSFMENSMIKKAKDSGIIDYKFLIFLNMQNHRIIILMTTLLEVELEWL